MDRLAIINYLIKVNNYKSYLNIGVFTGYTLDGVDCLHKIGVDPYPEHYHGNCEIISLTSDEYFKTLNENSKFDCVFIDGLHESGQVLRDIKNSLEHLSEKGCIILHDVNPPKLEHTTTGINGEWTGDTYKAFIKFQMQHPEYEAYTIDTDWGCGVIHNPARDGGNIGWIDMKSDDIEKMLDWDYFDRNRKALLNLITIDEFKTKMNEKTKDHNVPA